MIAEPPYDRATGTELMQLSEDVLPERQQQLSETALHELRITRAYEGLEIDSVHNQDSETLALHSLPLLPGTVITVEGYQAKDGAMRANGGEGEAAQASRSATSRRASTAFCRASASENGLCKKRSCSTPMRRV